MTVRTVGVSSAGYLVGEFVPNAKLTFAKVEEMRRLHARGGLTYTEIGERFGVSRTAAERAIKGKTWAVPVAKMVQQLEAEDVPLLSGGEGRYLIARKATATRASVERAMKAAGVAWDGVIRKSKHTHCKQGHALEGDNLIVRKNGRQTCRECSRARWRAFARKKRAQRASQ
ncbi:hypothetical protein MASR1M42_13970 [Azonexus hydrophilus]